MTNCKKLLNSLNRKIEVFNTKNTDFKVYHSNSAYLHKEHKTIFFFSAKFASLAIIDSNFTKLRLTKKKLTL